ncbi:MAG: T9SS type A sorting domain-containing protein [Bacteroides sp.]|nr:T9SS type A sorting domain-containing protein [Bacteroides sp.]
MNKPTRILSLLAFTAFAGCAWAQEDMKLKVVANDGEGNPVEETMVTVESKLRFTQNGVGVFDGDALTAEFNYADFATLSFYYDTLSSVSAVDAMTGLRLRNNPVAESLEFVGMTEKVAELTVIDLRGAVKVSVPEWKGEAINVNNLTPGLYFVTVNQKTFKFIKK